MVGGSKTSLIGQYNQIHDLGFDFLFSKAAFFDIILPLTVGFIVVSGAIALACYMLTFSLLKMRRKSVVL